MRIQRGTILALAAAVILGACAPGATGAPGTPRPAETRYSTAAKLQLAQAEGTTGERQQQLYQQALDQSMQGIEAQPNNPQHYYLAGLAQSGLGDFAAADTMWERATELYPAYAEEVLVAREQAWAHEFNEGVNAYNAGDMAEAVRHWERANAVFDRRPEAYFNLAAVYSQEQRYDDAMGAFRSALEAVEREPGRELTPEEHEEREESRISALQNLGNLQLFTEQYAEAERTFSRLSELQPGNVAARSTLGAALARQGRQAEAMEVYRELLGMPNLSGDDLMSVGVGLFQAEEYTQAADAFRRITQMHPYNRDAWYNYLNALYAQQRWQDLIPVGERLVEIDPLNETAHLILVQAFRDTRQQPRALTYAERNIGLPVYVDEFQMRHDAGRTILRGVVTGNRAAARSPVRLEFTFFGADNQPIGTQTVTVTAPALEATTMLEVALDTQSAPTGFRYRVLE